MNTHVGVEEVDVAVGAVLKTLTNPMWARWSAQNTNLRGKIVSGFAFALLCFALLGVAVWGPW